MGNKSRIQLTVDPYVLQRFDKKVENRSKRVEKYMKKIAEIEEGKDQDLVNRKHELEEEVTRLEDEIGEKKAKKATKESELKAIESALEQEEETKEMEETAISALTESWKEFRKKTRDPDEATKRLATTEEFYTWLEKVDLEKEEFKQKVRRNAEEGGDKDE